MAAPNKLVPPAVKIYMSQNAGSSENFSDLMFGIEEEGIPFELIESEYTDVSKLAHEAALASNLAVGVGVTSDLIALHYDKLPEDRPLYVIDREIRRHSIRDIGINAARLVKRMPFNEI